MTTRPLRLPAVLGLVALAACSRAPQKSRAVGTVDLGVAISALTGDGTDVDSIVVTVTSNTNMSIPPVVANLVSTSQGWTGVIGGLPAGYDHFDVAASEMGTEEYAGSTDATVLENQTIVVMILLQQYTPNAPFTNAAPVISSVTASSIAVAPGDNISLFVSATAGTMGDILTYAWSDGYNIADFSSLIDDATVWTAPAMQGSYTITITVTNQLGASVAVSLLVSDLTTNGEGSGNIDIQFNAWPVITEVYATPSNVVPGDMTQLTLDATSPDGDTLSYAWSDNGCGGMFSSTIAQNPTWTAPGTGPMSGTCELSVVVTDQYGGYSDGSTTIQVAPVQFAALAPLITSAFQDLGSAALTDIINLNVAAADPQGSSMTFAWGVSAGLTAGMQTNPNSGSSTFSATVNAYASSYTITATVTDVPTGLATIESYTVTGLALESIAVTPFSTPLAFGVTQAMTATGTFSDMSTRNLTAVASWLSDTPTVAAVNSYGSMTTQSLAGTANISATAEMQTGSAPANVTPGYIQTFTGDVSTCAVRQDGTLWCWGDDSCGQAGDGPANMCLGSQQNTGTGIGPFVVTPQQVGSDSDWMYVAVGGQEVCGLKGQLTCGIHACGAIWCWGTPQVGTQPAANGLDGWTINQFGDNELITYAGRQVSMTASGGSGGNVWSMQAAPSGGTIDAMTGIYTPGSVADVNDIIAVTDGDGMGDTATATMQLMSLLPHQVGSATNWISLSVGEEDTVCALDSSSHAWCWGPNYDGEAGDGETNSQPAPVQVPMAMGMTMGATWADISAADQHVCGAMSDGTGWCWGANPDGELGNNTLTSSLTPVQVLDCSPGDDNGACGCSGSFAPSANWVTIVSGTDNSCGIRSDGSGWCWGGDYSGELGTGAGVAGALCGYPEAIDSGSAWSEISLGNAESCGVDTTGAAWCWGYNGGGELGDGMEGVGTVDIPMAVLGGAVWQSINEGGDQGCAVRNDNQLLCWGNDEDYELGDNEADGNSTPVPQQVVDMTQIGTMIVVSVDNLVAPLQVTNNSDVLDFSATGSPRSQIFPTPIPNGDTWGVTITLDPTRNCHFVSSFSGMAGAPGGTQVVAIECGVSGGRGG